MDFQEYIQLISDNRGFFPTQCFRRIIHKNPRNTAREEAIAHEVLRQANPRQPISGSHPWAPEEQFVYQQLWIHTQNQDPEWRDIPTLDSHLYEVETTPDGKQLPVPNAVKQPQAIPMDLQAKIREALGEE
jgi:hypothetical protein